MSNKLTLGERMKEFYEKRTRQYLTRRTPVIIRLDGKAFHTYTKGLKRPFDEGLMEDMAETTRFLCQEIQGVKCGYTQSDEITLLLTDFNTFETDAWFDYQIQKIVSVAASIATAKFNQLRLKRMALGRETKVMKNCDEIDYIAKDMVSSTSISTTKLAYFDARVFQISEYEEVVNCFIWRQRDAIKNSIQMLAQSLFSQRDLHKKNGEEQKALCAKVGHPWEDLPINKQRGSFVVKSIPAPRTPFEMDEVGHFPPPRPRWDIVECPDFTEDRDSILKLLKPISRVQRKSFS